MRKDLKMLTKIKICGIKTAEEVALINRYPITYMGLIFAPSKRQVTPETARMLRGLLKPEISAVGVFVNEAAETVNELVLSCNLQVVQLHGDESVDYCRQMKAKVWKSISVKDEESLKAVETYAPYVDAILLDTYSDGQTGGTGKSFNWDLVKSLSEKYPIILAGGLAPDNVVTAINTVHPQVVDLNSGLETNLIKDPQKVALLFENLKEAYRHE